jgi:Flp pilus assembly protein TadD
MKRTTTALALVAAVLLSGATVASAAEMSNASSTSTLKSPDDMLSLSTAQRKTAWNDLRTTAGKQTAPSSFSAKIGSVVPSTLKLESIPTRAARDVPSLRPYDFAMVQGKLLIVNPSDKKIVEVITG